MSQIKIKLDENSAYLLETKDEYELEEALSTFRNIVSKLSNFLPENEKVKTGLAKPQFTPNEVFVVLNSRIIEKFGNNVIWEDKSTMRCFYSRSKLTGRKLGLVWLEPIINTLIIHLRKRKEGYKNVDSKEKIKYSKEGSRTLGDYPIITINKESDIDYVMKIIEFIYSNT